MNAGQRTKAFLKEAFPSIWVRWHLMHHPKSAEQELFYLDRIVPRGAVTVDVGAHCGLYTRKLARLSRQVYAFEPSRQMADLLRRTSASNVSVHEIALSDHTGNAELLIPQDGQGLVYGLASLEPAVSASSQTVASVKVPTSRLDAIVQQDVAFVKIDVEGHELSVLKGAIELLEQSQPVFLWKRRTGTASRRPGRSSSSLRTGLTEASSCERATRSRSTNSAPRSCRMRVLCFLMAAAGAASPT